jgi:N-methylhydantoinase A
VRAVGTGARPAPELPEGEMAGPDASAARAPDGTYDRALTAPGMRITGPAVITEFDSTTVVLEGYEAEVDRYFNILIRPSEGQS